MILITQPSWIYESHWIIHFKRMKCVVCELYLNLETKDLGFWNVVPGFFLSALCPIIQCFVSQWVQILWNWSNANAHQNNLTHEVRPHFPPRCYTTDPSSWLTCFFPQMPLTSTLDFMSITMTLIHCIRILHQHGGNFTSFLFLPLISNLLPQNNPKTSLVITPLPLVKDIKVAFLMTEIFMSE